MPLNLEALHPSLTRKNPVRSFARGLLVILLLVLTTGTSGGSGGPLPLNSTGSSASVRRFQGVVDVLLRVESDDEGGDVDDLLADSDVSLSDEDSGVVDRLGESGRQREGS
jgi:hypothetical protein